MFVYSANVLFMLDIEKGKLYIHTTRDFGQVIMHGLFLMYLDSPWEVGIGATGADRL